MREGDVLRRLRRIATSPAARGLLDDVAVLGRMVITHDTIAEGVHFLSSDPAASVGWKLVAVNLSDLAAKGATPAGALLSLTITSSGKWEVDFLSGIEAACESYGLPLIGGDTIALPEGAPRVLGLTAIGHAGKQVPDRASAKAGDSSVADRDGRRRGCRPRQLQADRNADGTAGRHLSPPGATSSSAGQALAPHAHAMMDVSDGLLLDARGWPRRAAAAVRIDLDSLPLSDRFHRRARSGSGCTPVRRNRRRRLCACSPRSRRTSTRQHFLYQKGRRSSASGASKRASRRFDCSTTVIPSHCRRGWVLSIRTISIGGFPLRQWLIGISGLASGMMLALLLH